MKRFVTLLAALMAAGALIVGLAPTASAAAAANSQVISSTSTQPYCVVLVDKAIDPRTGVSRVADRACSTTSLAAAADKIPALRSALGKAGIRAGDPNKHLAMPNAATELARVYETVNFASGKVSVYGNYGTCDAGGYVFDSTTLQGPYASAVGIGSCAFMRTYLRGRVGGSETYNYSLPSADCRSRCQNYTNVTFHA